MDGHNLLFDAINALFTDKHYIWSLTPEFINQNIFMINRRLAIQYPMQVAAMNIPKMNNSDLIKVWSDYFYNGKSAPSWVYTKGSAKKNQAITVEEKIPDSLIKKYAQRYHISVKDVKDALRLNHDKAVAEMKDFKKLIEEIENVKAYNERNSE